MGVFLGWMPDAAVCNALAALRRPLADRWPGEAGSPAWRTPAQWHITLRYLGAHVEDEVLDRLAAAMDAAAPALPPADARLAGVAHWPGPAVLVATVDPSPALGILLARLESLAQASGFVAGRDQVPHVTLARLPRMGPCIVPLDVPAEARFHIGRVDLLASAPGGYRSLASWALGPGTTAA